MSALVLYGTTYCHLCEEAEAVLKEVGVSAVYIDIAEDDELIESYGTRIPVLRRRDNGMELGWPFDVTIVTRFVA
ncbi:MAG: glutaredoxin [Gallionellales bacterium GWA2_59_43]|nr:MAG: glutaredoxin [Gallionellales bacterium GWA2_59_43]